MSQSENLEALRRKRGNIKASLTRFCSFVDGVKKSEPDKRKLAELELRLTKVESLISEFEQIQGEIENIEKEQFDKNGTENFESAYFEAISNATIVLSELSQPSQTTTPVVDSNTASHNPSIVPPRSNYTDIKLPTIELPKFNGAYEQWHEFRTLFISLIHDCEFIKPISKFHYLRASLEGPAAECISSIELKAENYKVAWDILNERFNNKRLAVHNHINSLMHVRGVKPESAKGLRNLIDSLSKHLIPLKSLGIPTDEWDVLLIFIIVERLDPVTVEEWENYKLQGDLPTLKELKTFLRDRADHLEKIELHKNKLKPKMRDNHKAFITNESQRKFSCFVCNKAHSIYSCTEFLGMSPYARLEKVRTLKLCINCLKNNHKTKDCKSSKCRKCNGTHHTLVHLDQGQADQSKPDQGETITNQNNTSTQKTESCHSTVLSGQVLLSTAVVDLVDASGNKHNCRALLDSGSMSNFITEELFNKLGLPKTNTNISVVGIGQIEANLNSSCEVEMHSRQNGFYSKLRCLVISNITENVPNVYFERSTINVPQNLLLADPTFNEPGKIDLLIGAGAFWQIICNGHIQLGKLQPVLQKTKLGWIISGPCKSYKQYQRITCNFNKCSDIQSQLTRFWEIEEVSAKHEYSNEENLAEEHFIKTVRRDNNGRFIVSIPLKEPITKLGESKQLAQNQFYNLERRLNSNPKLKQMYSNFMREYEDLGHMSKVEINDNQIVYYSPHHGVLKEDSVTTKLRVVFNSSALSSSGVSYNNLQMVGPKVQEDLVSILTRFREHAYVVSADIAKMYRQVAIDDQFKPLQLILWRYNVDDQLNTYSLNTVTYGTASAAFLAIRCLKQLAIEHQNSNPKAANTINRDFYVDDLLTGADTVEETIDLCRQVSAILSSGCFELRKWKSNSPRVFEGIKAITSPHEVLHFGPHENTKTLGLLWSCKDDTFSFNINSVPTRGHITKRVILSTIAQIFDPLGLICPCIVVAKIMLQNLWSLKLSWDDPVPDNLAQKFSRFRSELKTLRNLNIPRHILCKNRTEVELHGFSDASQNAYGCCIYLRSADQYQHVHVNLLCAKSRVAPVKSLSIPRLELCAAQMLAQLFERVKDSMTVKFHKYYLWSDSTVALSWIRTSPHTLQTFVANRVSDIQRLTDIDHWKYVPTELNPADGLSRGLSPAALINSDVWFSGPLFLKKSQSNWPIDLSVTKPISDLPEIRKQALSLVETNQNLFPFDRFSSLTRMSRTMAYVLRFIHNCRINKEQRHLGILSQEETNTAFDKLVQIAQFESFPKEMSHLSKNMPVEKKSRLLSLSPFLDNKQIARVGGRLKYSPYVFEKKHPALLSSKHHLTYLVFRHEHYKLLHLGPQALLAAVRETIWATSGKNLAKKIVRECVVCCRYKPKINNPLMGNLPVHRISPSPPFDKTGVDYAGPFIIKDRKGRGCKTLKSYLCLFVCLVTKAVHLELVTELSTQSFLETFQRFVSRRGRPSHIYSDNGSNFIGANSQLKELGDFLISNRDNLTEALENEFRINWHFIPAYSPHMGGLWEAGVKSTKHHIKRVMGNTLLTFENFYSLITQIEGILNSRPLTPLSTDPNDLEALTPAHFLIGRTLQAVPHPDLRHIPTGRLSHYQLLQQLKQHFWTRWSKEYLSQLQERHKWRTPQKDLQIGAMVLVKDEHLPPSKWQLGRIHELHPGQDNVVRVVSVKVASGVIKRSVIKICPLPIMS